MKVNFNVTNQLNVPALRSGITLPAPGQKGRIFYDATGNGMYIDDGIAWLPINAGGGGGVGTLQQVTDAGNVTNDNILLNNSNLVFVSGAGGETAKGIVGDLISGIPGDYEFQLPDAGGTFVMKVNGTEPDNNGNVELTAPASTNFANTNLTFNANRSHNLAAFLLEITGQVGGVRSTFSQVNNIIKIETDQPGNSNRALINVINDGGSTRINVVATSNDGLKFSGIKPNANGFLRIETTDGILINSAGNTGVSGQMLTSQGNGFAPIWRYPAGYLYRNALTQIGESVNIIPATTRAVQRLIYTGTTDASGLTTIPLTGINIGLLLNLYGIIEYEPGFRTSMNFTDYSVSEGETFVTRAFLVYRTSINSVLISTAKGALPEQGPIVGAYTVVVEFQQT